MSRDGAGLGIFLIVTATRSGAMKYAAFNNFKNRMAGCLFEAHDERRRDLLCLEGNNALLFLKRIEADECSTLALRKLFYINQGEDDYKPSLYVDFDKKIFYSMYVEPASYEDYVPIGWYAKYENFLNLIPVEMCYWTKRNHLED